VPETLEEQAEGLDLMVQILPSIVRLPWEEVEGEGTLACLVALAVQVVEEEDMMEEQAGRLQILILQTRCFRDVMVEREGRTETEIMRQAEVVELEKPEKIRL